MYTAIREHEEHCQRTGKHTRVDEQGMITIRSLEPEGSFFAPSLDVMGNSTGKPSSFKYELNLPENIGELVGEGELVISVETTGNWSFFALENKTHLYKKWLTMSAAEQFCINQGGHLASVGSQEEQDEVIKVDYRSIILIGGRRKAGEEEGWEWLDGRPWTYQNWDTDEPDNGTGKDCIYMNVDGTWRAYSCHFSTSFICHHPVKVTENHTVVTYSRKALLRDRSFYFWWNQTSGSSIPDISR